MVVLTVGETRMAGTRVIRGFTTGIVLIFALILLALFLYWYFTALGNDREYYHPDDVFDLAFIPGTDWFVSTQLGEQGARVLDMFDGRVIAEIASHATTVGVSDRGMVVVGTLAGEVLLWDSSSKSVVRRWKLEKGSAYSVAISRDGSRVVCGQGPLWKGPLKWEPLPSYSLWVWDATTGSKLSQVDSIAEVVSSIDISPNNEFVALRCLNSMTAMWAIRKNEYLWKRKANAEHFGLTIDFHDERISISPDGTRLCVGEYIWNANDGREMLRLKKQDGPSVASSRFDHSGRYVLTGSGLGKVRLWDAETGNMLWETTAFANRAGVRTAAISSDGKWILTGGRGGIGGFTAAKFGRRVKDPYIRLWRLPRELSQ